VERRGSLKRWANHALFGWAAFDTWLRRYDRKRPHFAVRVPGTDTVDAGPLLTLVGSALGSGTHLRRSRHVAVRTGVTSAEVEGYGPVPFQVDGDYLGDVDHLELHHEPDVLRLVIPR
jgi:hypothetical protein